MHIRPRFHRSINVALVISLLLSLYPPILWSGLGSSVAQAAPLPALSSAIANEPAATAQPLSIARVQSSYSAGSETTISYHITNNLPPTLAPDTSSAATITDTIDILASFVLTDDMNTLRNVELDTTIVNGTVVDAGSGSQSGSDISWVLPDLPPSQSTIVTFTLQTPATAAGFVDLDSGAIVSAEQWQNPISTQAKPANIVPDTIDPSLMSGTVDADISDEDMLWISAEFTQDPTAAFELVKSYGFDAYDGSLRGTRGTIWGEAGNSADQASALIAMLRAAGVPARYRHGSLSVAQAQSLLSTMFPADSGVAGNIPAGTLLADPVNDAELIALAQDHWWVEAYLPSTGAWTDLDPTFAAATIGDSFATPGANDRIAELPDAIRHKITFQSEIEKYSEFPVAGSFLARTKTMTVTLSSAELAARPIIFGHTTSSELLGGLVSATTTHTYTPFFQIDQSDDLIFGEPYQDLLTTFALATNFTVGAWLTVTSIDPDGNSETFTRTVKDLLGPDVRRSGGSPSLAPDGEEPFYGLADLYTTWVLPNIVPEVANERRAGDLLEASVTVGQAVQALEAINADDGLSPAEIAEIQDNIFEIQLASSLALLDTGSEYAADSDVILGDIERSLSTKMYYETPRIVTVATALGADGETTEYTVDLRSTKARTLPHPAQAADAALTANWIKGVQESYLEGEVLTALTGEPAATTARLFEAANAQGIESLRFRPNQIRDLAIYDLGADAEALITEALLTGKTIIVPSERVLLDGETMMGWWQVDPATGETIGVFENGLHNAAIDYKFTVDVTKKVKEEYEKIAKGLGKLYDLIAKRIIEATGGGGGARLAAFAGAHDWLLLPAHLCPVANCGVEQFGVEPGL